MPRDSGPASAHRQTLLEKGQDSMTEAATRRYTGSASRRLFGWVARFQQQLSDRVFADGDAFARENGWEITKTTGRFGFGGRIYRDPRFGPRAPEAHQRTEYTARGFDAGSG
jgi:hypothetical protein